jgi:hypothetical protein
MDVKTFILDLILELRKNLMAQKIEDYYQGLSGVDL